LMATVRENPASPTSRPRCTDAIPPDAIGLYSRYRPMGLGCDGSGDMPVG
jgi:hypothetical protein